MKKIAIVLATGFAALLPLAAVTIPTAAKAQVAVYVQGPPPPPRYERVPPPRRGCVWSPGHYEHRGGRWEYDRGR